MNLGDVLGVIGASIVFFAPVIWWLYLLIEALRVPRSSWQDIGRSKVGYILFMVFLLLIGAFVYFLLIRPELKQVGAIS